MLVISPLGVSVGLQLSKVQLTLEQHSFELCGSSAFPYATVVVSLPDDFLNVFLSLSLWQKYTNTYDVQNRF